MKKSTILIYLVDPHLIFIFGDFGAARAGIEGRAVGMTSVAIAATLVANGWFLFSFG